MKTDSDRRIEAFVDEHHAPQAGLLGELVRVPSDNPPGACAPHAARAAELLEGLGLEVERHPVPEARVREAGMTSVTNLIVRRRFGDGPTVALNAHGDVVPPGEGWTRDPYGAEVADGVMYGRGVAVSKSDFATYAYALLAAEASGAPLAGTVELHLTYDEESGGTIGPKWILDEGLSRPDLAISAGFAHGVVTAHNGCLHLEVRVTGRQAHAAMPHTGRDALEAATDALAAVYAERRRLAQVRSAVEGIGSPSVTVGLVRGGVNTNVVPDLVTLRIDRRMIPEEDAVAVERDLAHLVEAAASRHEGIGCEVRRIMLAEPFAPVDGADRLTATLLDAAERVLGERLRAHGVPLYTDARHYAAAGIPTVLYGAGPGSILEANAHGADEQLRLADLRRATLVVAAALTDLLAG